MLSLPILLEPGSASGSSGSAAMGRAIGALQLSWQAPAQPDSLHAANLLRLAAALAPGLEAAAEPLKRHCSLFLGSSTPPQRQQASEAASESEGESSGSEAEFTESDDDRPAGQQRGDEEAAAAAQQPGWAAGSCRDEQPPAPEDPGSSAPALVVAAGGNAAPATRERERGPTPAMPLRRAAAVAAEQQPDSPSAMKARAKAAAEPGPSRCCASSSQPALGGGEEPATGLLKPSPNRLEGSVGVLQQPDVSWRRLLRFADPGLEALFAQWHNEQNLQVWRHGTACLETHEGATQMLTTLLCVSASAD